MTVLSDQMKSNLFNKLSKINENPETTGMLVLCISQTKEGEQGIMSASGSFKKGTLLAIADTLESIWAEVEVEHGPWQ